METLPLFPADDLYVAPATVEPESEPEDGTAPCGEIPGQLDLFADTDVEPELGAAA